MRWTPLFYLAFLQIMVIDKLRNAREFHVKSIRRVHYGMIADYTSFGSGFCMFD